MEYLIRDCKEEDLPALVELCVKHAEFEQAQYNPKGKEELLKNALFSNVKRLFCLVVEVDSKVVGYTSYIIDFSTWDAKQFLYMDCLFLEPDFKGYGIGEKLIDELKIIAQRGNCVNMQWQTPVFNERAIKFYERIGASGKEKVRFSLALD
jgi:ribosomal protein S18 acetylase RimI-like enzyme